MADDWMNNALQASSETTLVQQTPQFDNSNWMSSAAAAAESEKPAQEQFNLSASVNKYLSDGVKYAQSKITAGQQDLSDSLIWSQVMAGTMKYEDALNETSEETKAKYRAENIDPMEKTLWWTDPRRIIGEMSQAAPFMAAVTAGGGATALAGAGVGSVVPGAGTLVGAEMGMATGSFTTASILATASMYGTLRKEGVDHEKASQFASNYGAVSGAINAFRFMGASGALKKQYESQLAASAMKMADKGAAGRQFQKAFENMVHENTRMGMRHFLKEVGLTQVLPAEIDEMAKIITEAWSSGKWEKMDWQQVTPRLLEAFKQSMIVGTGFIGGARALGFGAGKAAAFKKFVQDIDDSVNQIKLEEREKAMPKEPDNAPDVTPEKEHKQVIQEAKDFIKEQNKYIKEAQKALENDPDNDTLRQQLRDARKGLLQARAQKRKAEYRLARQQINDMMEGAKAQYTIEKEEGRTDYRRTRKIIQDAIMKSDMTDAHKNSLVGMITKTDTFESLTNSHMSKPKTPGKTPEYVPSVAEQLTKRLDALIEMDAKNEALGDLKEQLGRKVIVPNGRKTRGEISYDAQLQFQRYKQLIADEMKSDNKRQGLAKDLLDERTLQAAKDAAEADAGNPYGLAADIDARIAADVIGLREKSSKEIADIVTRVEKIVDDGENSHLAKLQYENAARAEKLRDAIRNANGEYPIYDKNGLKRSFSDDARRINTFGVKIGTWDMLVKNMFQDSLDPNAHFLLDIHDAVQSADANTKAWRQKFFDMATEGDAKLAKTFEKLHRDAYLDDVQLGKLTFKNQDGKTVNLASLVQDGKMNRNILMKIYLAMKNPLRAKGLVEGNKLTYEPRDGKTNLNKIELKPTDVSAQALIEKTLTADEKRIADNIGKFWNESDFSDLVQSHHVDEYSLPLKQHDQYDGTMYRVGEKPEEGSWLGINSEFNQRRSIVPNSLIDTVQSARPYEFKPLTPTAGKQINQLVNWMSFRKVYKDTLYVLKDPKFREVIETKFEPVFMQTVDKAFESIVGQRGISIDNQFKIAEIYNANAAAAFTTAKIPSAFAQYAGLINVMQEIGPIDTAVGAIDFFLNPVKNIKTLMNTDYMRNRSGSIDNALKDFQNSKLQNDFTGKKQTLTDWLAFPMRSTDNDVHMIGGWAVYSKFYDEAYARTKNKETAHAVGIGMFERVMNRTQGSAAADQITSVERGGPFQKGFMTFFKQPIQAFNYQTLAWKKYMANPTGAHLLDATKIMLATHAAQGIFEIMKGSPDLVNDDIEEKEKDKIIVRAARQFVNGPLPPGFSHLADALEVPFTNKKFNVKERPFEANLPFLAAVMSVKELSELAVDVAEKGDATMEQAMQGLFDVGNLTPFASKFPTKAVASKLKSVTRKPKGSSQEVMPTSTIEQAPPELEEDTEE